MKQMTNAITQKEFNNIKQDRAFSVVTFDGAKRISTYTGLSITQAMHEILFQQGEGYQCIVIRNLPALEVSWERKDYEKYLGEVV